MKTLDNIYKNGSQTCCLKGKTYTDAQLGELVHSVVIEHTSEHEVIYGKEPTRGKHRESEIVVELQPPRASGCEATISSQG
jgi:hypothetical protein